MPETILRKHYMLTLRLDLTTVDLSYLESLVESLQPLGIVPVSLYQETLTSSGAVQQAYICHNECRKQQPPVELRQQPIAFETWATANPERYFLAKHNQEYIGVCLLEQEAAESDTLVSGFTGVLPKWSGRGVAKALKAHSLLYAKQCGFHYVETSNLVVNRGICAINKALGFQEVKRHLHTYPIPVASTRSGTA